MSGKGSKPRPLSISKEQFDSNWDKIFMKEKPISCFVSSENNRTADVFNRNGAYVVECREGPTKKLTLRLDGKSLNYAEDAAENWVEMWGAFSE